MRWCGLVAPWFAAGVLAQAPDPPPQAPAAVVASLEPASAIAGHRFVDTDGDGRCELVLLGDDGTVQRFAATETGWQPRSTLRLPDPLHSLVLVADLLPAPGVELLAVGPQGFVHWPWPEGDAAPEPVALAPRARFRLRVDRPQLGELLRDLDGDGRLDLLLPTLDGCQPWLQRDDPATPGLPRFQSAPLVRLPVAVTVQERSRGLEQPWTGELRVPAIATADLDGDGRPDLLGRDGSRHTFHLQGKDGVFASEPITVDLQHFVDPTPKATLAPGATAVLGDQQLLQRGDLDGDGIPDFVIAHRRKIWTFLSGRQGPQFQQAHAQFLAEDTSALLLLDLDDDGRADLLSFQVRIPSVGSLILGLVQSLDIDVRAVGYKSEGGRFAAIPAYRRTLTLRLPALLSLLARQDELVQRLLDAVGRARPSVRGAFHQLGAQDLCLVHADGERLELYVDTPPPPALADVRGRRELRRLLFEDPNAVFDLDRLFALLAGFVEQRATELTGGVAAARSLPLRDPAQWQVVGLLAGAGGEARRDDVLVVYRSPGVPGRLAFDLVRW